MKRWQRLLPRVFVWAGLTALGVWAALDSKQTLAYSSICTSCLATRSSVERSILGIAYEEKHRPTLHLYHPEEEPRLPKSAEGRRPVYEEIHGRPCEHSFARTGFCRYRRGGVGCGGAGGGEEVRNRNELMLGVFSTFDTVDNKDLAVRSYRLIEREFPLEQPARTSRRNLIEKAQDQAERHRRMILLGDLLALVRNEDDWRMVLEHLDGGFQGDPPLLSEVAALVVRLEKGEPAENASAAAILAERSATSDELMKRMMSDGDRVIASTAKYHVIRAKRLELFDLALMDYQPSDPQRREIRKYSTDDFRRLFALGDKSVDELCEDSIWYADADHFALLDPMLASLNRHDSPEARETVGKLLRGGNPYRRGGIPCGRGAVVDPEHMWNQIATMREPMKKLRKTVTTTQREPHIGMSKEFYEAVKGIGASRDPSQWPFLRDCYRKRANNWAMAVLGRALHQLDPAATETLLIDDLRNGRRVPAAISAMGFIGSRKFVPALEEFAARPRPAPQREYHLPTGYYEADGDGTALLTYALHRCRGIPSWKLVRNADGIYDVEKPPDVSR